MGTDEQADWAAALGCDPGAFARIFDRHRDAVFRQALRLLELPADAEEVASAAFFELWRKRDRVVPVAGSVRPWLLVTTANLARNSHRVRVRREQFLRRLTDEHRPDGGADAFERVDDGVLRQELAAGLRQLKPQDVALVTMTALDGYSVREVAQLLGLTDGAARVRLSRANARLRGLLPEHARTRIDHQEVAQ
ncbi:RNA polymerase sigma factor [Amnibacterium kyonggiense]